MFRIAIVGRPNVGKSTLFNRICGGRKAIVGDEPGITRDRIYGTTSWAGKTLEVLDTGGMVPGDPDVIPTKVLEQVSTAMKEADLLLLVVDGRAGMTPADELLLPNLRKAERPVWVVVNKTDTPELEFQASQFYSLGFEPVVPISAEHNRGIGELLDAIAATAPDTSEPNGEAEEEIAIAVVGRPNVGKSSLVNRLLGIERAIVCEIPGTTRDSVDTRIVRDGIRYRIIDTAGIRRKGKTEAGTEKISVVMAKKNLASADVAFLLLDAEEGVTKLDAAIGGYASDYGCSVIIVLNKWDKVPKDTHTLEEQTQSIRRWMKYLAFAPVLAVSALTGQRVSKLFELAQKASQGRRIRVATGALNNLFVPDLESHWRGDHPSQRLNIRYITQVGINPPVFTVFTSGREKLHFSIERFLVNQLRDKYGFFATPIRIQQRTKKPRSLSRR